MEWQKRLGGVMGLLDRLEFDGESPQTSRDGLLTPEFQVIANQRTGFSGNLHL